MPFNLRCERSFLALVLAACAVTSTPPVMAQGQTDAQSTPAGSGASAAGSQAPAPPSSSSSTGEQPGSGVGSRVSPQTGSQNNAQNSPQTGSQTSAKTKTGKPEKAEAGIETPRPPKPPALIDPAGPAVSLESSEALFDIAVALNACGYDNGLEASDPIRAHIRGQVNRELQQSAPARDSREKLCNFINQHRLSEARRDLAQYVSLSLYLNPPPDLSASVDQQDMPPDATQVMEILPLLRTFATDARLHLIWIANRPAYEEQIAKLHDPLTRMILDTNSYLKMPAPTYSGSRFLVVIEPLLSPAETNARVYGTDYVVVTSPVNGAVRMQEVRHTYLHYMIEPLLYARATAMDRLLPILKTVRDAPLDYVYRSDVVSLVIESMIRAIEARTMETDVTIFEIPRDTNRADLPRIQHEHDLSVQKDAAARDRSVQSSMQQGYVLTRYFYEQMRSFEGTPESLKEAIGPMVYGMDVDQQVHRAREVHFAEQGEGDVIRHAAPRTLDQAEAKLKQGDANAAQTLAQQAIKDHSADTARADYLLALSWLMKGDMQSAENDFAETIRLTSDPRLLAWSHIYLGRIHDVKEERDAAVTEYQTALAVRDGQQDTRLAAESGLAKPFALPHRAGPASDDEGEDGPGKPQAGGGAGGKSVTDPGAKPALPQP